MHANNLARKPELQAQATVINRAQLEDARRPEPPEREEERPDDPYLPPDEEYRMMRLVRGNRSAKRLRLCPANGMGDSAKWAFVMNIKDDLDRESATVPQIIILVTNIGTFRIEGYGLEQPNSLYDMLDEERVREIVAYCPKRHGPALPPAPYVSAIAEIEQEREGQGD